MGEDKKKPAKIRTDAKATDGYILTVDGKPKTRYETEKEATAEAAKLKQRFPVIQVTIYDAAKDVYIPVALQEPETQEP